MVVYKFYYLDEKRSGHLVVNFINTMTYFFLDNSVLLSYVLGIESSQMEDNMPRKSPYPIVLSASERSSLEKISLKYTSPYYLVVRAKTILMASQGLDNKTIGEKLSLPRQIVSKWRKRFFDERIEGLEDQSRPGRPSSFSPSRDRSG